MDGGGEVPACYIVRLPDPSDGHDPSSHRPVRAAHQPVQREDLHLPLVLDGVRCHGDVPQLPALDLGARLPVQSRALHPQAPAHHEQAEPRRRPRREVVVQVRRAVPAPRRGLRAEAGREELDGSGRC